MKNKLILTGLLLSLAGISMGQSAQSLLKKARDDYYKQQREASKPKVERTANRVVRTSDGEVLLEEEYVEEVAPKTPMEKLEYNAAKAMERVDFYERVVRSVAREESEIKGYNEVLGKNKKPKAVKKTETKK